MYKVNYEGGQSRKSQKAVDYMIAEIDGIELYAEISAENEANYNYKCLTGEIIKQAQQNNIDVSKLRFKYDFRGESD